MKALEKLLPAKQECIVPDGAEEVTLIEMDPSQDRRNNHRDSVEDGEEGHAVRCQQQ